MEIIPWKSGDQPIPMGTTAIFEMKAEDYHSDPFEKPSLSSSIAKRMVGASPYHGWLMHPKLGGCSESSSTMDRGSLIHALILGQDTEDFALIDADDFRSKAARSARDSARAEGKIPVKVADFRDAEATADEVHEDLLRDGILLSGHSELVFAWVESADGVDVQCRAMVDHIIPESSTIIDFKNCESASPDSVRRSIYSYGYDIQFAAYTSAFCHLFPDLAGREDFLWAFIEQLPDESPKKSATQLYRPDGVMRELGRSRWGRAVKLWAECLKSGRWPFYGNGPLQISPQSWIVKEELGERHAAD